MEILGQIHDITIPKGYVGKMKIRTVDDDGIIISKIEFFINENGEIVDNHGEIVVL